MSAKDEDFQVAADLTLYSNPVIKALHRSYSKAAIDAQKARATAPSSSSAESGEMIASDMTKYDSPLAELERHAIKQQVLEEGATKPATGQPPPRSPAPKARTK